MAIDTLERTHDVQLTGDEVLDIIEDYGRTIHDHTEVVDFESEFPRLLGRDGLWLLTADDNDGGSFKWRGAHAGAHNLQQQGHDTLLVPSAGNHARGAILAAKALNMNITVVVPQSAPRAKKEGLRELWDDPRLDIKAIGDTFDESLTWALDHPERGALLHPYDDPAVIAGQGTLVDATLEGMKKRGQELNHIVVPVGGGGLVAGVLQRLNELDRDDVMVHAVQARGSNSLRRSLGFDMPLAATRPNQRYGGSAVSTIGMNALEICNKYRDQLTVTTVSDGAVDDVIDHYKSTNEERLIDPATYPPYEPTTLVAVAGMRRLAKVYSGNFVVVGSGHNAPLDSPARTDSTLRTQVGAGYVFG